MACNTEATIAVAILSEQSIAMIYSGHMQQLLWNSETEVQKVKGDVVLRHGDLVVYAGVRKLCILINPRGW